MDESNFFSRFSRIAQTAIAGSSTVLKFAASNALGTNLDHEKQAEILRETLGQMKGPVMKVAQFLATVPGALPPEYADEFLTLQTNAPPMGEGFVRRRMRGELGQDWQEQFQEFDLTPSFAASLGQVHRATTQDGRAVACKLQYPEMQSVIEGDLAQLKFFLKIFGTWSKALDTEEIFEEIKEKLLEELDYERELHNLSVYKKIFQGNDEIHVPEVICELSTKRLLTMQWVEGKSLLSFKDDALEKRNHLAKILFHAWYYPLYHYGVLHGDPHPGNYQVNHDGGLNLLDFGCVRIFDPTFLQGVIDLYRSLQKDDLELRVHALESWGFKNLSKELVEVMSLWANLLFEPLLDDRVRVIQEEIIGWEVASKVHDELNKLGGIKPPRSFVFMDRAAVGIGSVLFHLKAELNWHKLFEELIDDFSIEAVTKKQNQIL